MIAGKTHDCCNISIARRRGKITEPPGERTDFLEAGRVEFLSAAFSRKSLDSECDLLLVSGEGSNQTHINEFSKPHRDSELGLHSIAFPGYQCPISFSQNLSKHTISSNHKEKVNIVARRRTRGTLPRIVKWYRSSPNVEGGFLACAGGGGSSPNGDTASAHYEAQNWSSGTLQKASPYPSHAHVGQLWPSAWVNSGFPGHAGVPAGVLPGLARVNYKEEQMKSAPAVDDKGMRLTARDLELLDFLSSAKVLTARQIGALYFMKPPCYEWEVEKTRAAAHRRISILMGGGYLRSARVPGTLAMGYYLGPASAALLKAAGLSEISLPRYAERKETYALANAMHDLPLNSLIVNLMILEKLRDDLRVLEFRGEREMGYKFPDMETEFRPDSYLRLALGDTERACFFELHRGAAEASRIQTKLVGYAEFIKRGMKELLAINYRPVFCWIVPDMDRLGKVATFIRSFKIKYRRGYPWVDKGYFFISTDRRLDLSSLDRGELSENALLPGCWLNENLEEIDGLFA